MKNIKGSLILLLTAAIWGMAFVAQSTASDSIGGFTFNAVRSFLGALFLLTFIGVRRIIEKMRNNTEKIKYKDTVKGGIICGVILFAAVNFQQFGIAAYPEGTAASGRSGFITATYVVMVAIFEGVRGKKMRPALIAAVIGCIVGMYLLCFSGGFEKIYTGDILVFLCAICFTAYIIAVDRFAEADSVKLSCIQFFVCALLSSVPMMIFEKPELSALISAWLPIVYTGVLSSGVGYTLQIVGQRYTEPAVASIVMSLESVFAALAGWVILQERLSGKELIGCVLVFLSVILAQIQEMKKVPSLKQAK
jgi:drug/metabolite transporter (DMT)-like permease